MLLLSISFDSLHEVLRGLYNEMLPQCSKMIVLGKVIGGFGALFFIASKAWQALARAEPIDLYPLLRPFALLICIVFFKSLVLETMNFVLSPIVTGTHAMFSEQVHDIKKYRDLKDQLQDEITIRTTGKVWLVDDEEYERKMKKLNITDAPEIVSMWGQKSYYDVKRSIRDGVHWFFETLFQAAGLVIDTLRTFFLIVLSILGPIVFGFSMYEAFQSTLSQWFTRYISIYLWLPISDLFATIMSRLQVLILEKDIEAMYDPNYIPDGTNAVYIIFMIIGCVGYTSVPSVANWIINAGNMGSSIGNQASAAMYGGKYGAAAGGAAIGNAAGRIKNITGKLLKRNK